METRWMVVSGIALLLICTSIFLLIDATTDHSRAFAVVTIGIFSIFFVCFSTVFSRSEINSDHLGRRYRDASEHGFDFTLRYFEPEEAARQNLGDEASERMPTTAKMKFEIAVLESTIDLFDHDNKQRNQIGEYISKLLDLENLEGNADFSKYLYSVARSSLRMYFAPISKRVQKIKLLKK